MNYVTHTIENANHPTAKAVWLCVHCHEPTGAGPCEKSACIDLNDRAARAYGVPTK